MPLVDVSDIEGKVFDYVICGGGTAGLTLAARLSADPAVSVLVLEAGKANFDDPAILLPAQYLRQLGDERYDWKFVTTPQEHCAGRSYVWPRGKGLGGSSAMNFMAYIRPPAEDVDAWETLGNPGWNWSNYLKYSKRSERFRAPSGEKAVAYRHTYHPSAHGEQGELQVCFPKLIMDGEVPYHMAMNNMGVKTVTEPLGGDVNGTWMSAVTIDPKSLERSYAVTAFLQPVLDRQNLFVLPEAYVEKILFSQAEPSTGEGLWGEAVQFQHRETTLRVGVGKEVILSAGTLKSPQILELSGIGNPQILHSLGIPCHLPLEAVGENVQEHIYFGISYEMDPNKDWNTLDRLRTDKAWAAEQARLFESQEGIHTLGLAGFTFIPMQQASPRAADLISSQCEKLETSHRDGQISPGLWEQYKVQLQALKDERQVDMEWTTLPQFRTFRSRPEKGKEYMTVLVALNHPFSRGSIHVASSDPSEQPSMEPRYFEDEFDMQLLFEGLRFARRVAEREPFRECIVREVDPGPAVQTEEEMREYIVEGLMTAFHTVGSCSMLPRDLGGVVDHKLKVYGTSNVRVVDLSIVPLHVAAHTQATAYAIAEQAADIIKGTI